MAREVRIGGARVDYMAKDAGFSRATKKVNRQLTGFQKKANIAKGAAGKLTASIASMAKGYLGVGAAIGAALGGAGIGAFIKSQSEMATKMEQFSRITGLTITQLQIFQKGMGEFAIASNTTNKALQTFAKATGEAKNGLASYARAFESLGISVDELEGKSMQELLNSVARGLKEVEDPAVRTSAAMLLFGGRGVEVAAALQKLNFENAEYVKSITDTGIVTDKQSKTLHGVTAAYDTLGDTLTTQKQILAAELAPEWTEMLGKFNEIAPFIFDVVTPAFKGLVGVITGVADAIGGIASGISKVISRIFDLNDEIDVTKGKSLEARREAALQSLERASNPRARRAARSRLASIDAEIAASTPQQLSETERHRIEREISNIESQIAAPGRRRGMPALRRRLVSLQTRLGNDIVSNVETNIIEPVAKPETGGGGDAAFEIKREADNSARTVMLNRIAMFGMAAGADTRAASEAAAVVKEAHDVVSDIIETETERFARANRAGRVNVDMSQQGMDATGASEMERFMRTGRNERFSQQLTEAESGIIRLSDEAKNRLEPVITGLDSQLENFFSSIIDGSKSAGDAFKNLAASIADAVFQALVLQPLINSITGGIGTALGIPVTPRASGGPVTARSPYLVGERGPELFVPNNAGTIVPNHAMGGGTSFAWNVNIQSTDGPGVRKALAEARPLFQQDAIEAVSNAARRPGGLRG